mmetsp:Transcript_5601/g.22051  ORF Transcript_5601/g.22051 Transcript_5601/m.22051 type:complete len:263 (-) Transcript_5601:147-935(-)
MHSNNEVGTIQNIAEIVESVKTRCKSADFAAGSFAREHILFHTDAAQSCGKVPVQATALGVDMITVVGHKFGAPKGVGALWIRSACAAGFTIEPCLHGGGQESGRRAGTENVLLAVALGAAASLATEEQRQTAAHMRRLTARLRDGIERHLGKMAGEAPTVRVNGPSDRERCLPNTLSISIEGVSASAVVTELGDRIAFSAGSACHAGGTTMSAVLRAMHFVEERGRGTIRLSCGRHTTVEEVDRAIPILGEALLRQLQRRH